MLPAYDNQSIITRLTTNYAKNYCNRTLIVKVIVENVVTRFFMGHSVQPLWTDGLCDERGLERESGSELSAGFTGN